MFVDSKPAGIQYHGMAGITQSCTQAIARLIESGVWIESARLLTAGESHAFLIQTAIDSVIAVKSGYSSGYNGEGPRGLADVLALFRVHQVQVEEVLVSQALLGRLEASTLTESDLKAIQTAHPVRPCRLGDYTWHGAKIGALGEKEVGALL
jgi:hypothetical protein